MESISNLFQWFTGGENQYMRLYGCMKGDVLWIAITIVLDLAVAAGYVMIALHWWKNERNLPPIPAKRALTNMRNIFAFCGICGYLFIPIKMFWPAWRLYDMFLVLLVYFTWKYALGARDLKVVYNELGRSTRLAEDLEKSREESKRKSFFLNAISHDLRTPLNGLVLQSNIAEMAISDGDDKEAAHEALAQIRSSTRVVADLLDCLLEYARLDWSEETHAPEEVGLAELIHDVVKSAHPLAIAKGIYLKNECPPGLIVGTDRVKLERILTNLVSNAMKFTSEGGVRVSVDRAGSGTEIHVIDTGVGVAPENRGRLFEEFFQVENNERDPRKGFGLGLAIARRLARQMGGDVIVDTAVGRGSRFTVVLPDVATVGRSAGQTRVAAEPALAVGQPA